MNIRLELLKIVRRRIDEGYPYICRQIVAAVCGLQAELNADTSIRWKIQTVANTLRREIEQGLDGEATLGCWIHEQLGFGGVNSREVPMPYRHLVISSRAANPMRLAWLDRLIENEQCET